MSVALAQVIQELTNGFSAQEAKAIRRFQKKDAYAPLAKFTQTMSFQVITSATRDHQNSRSSSNDHLFHFLGKL
jgi:predicted pyridoxine 5'-phosphate oxidase superfamily flavin-nucleotide-binding protein